MEDQVTNEKDNITPQTTTHLNYEMDPIPGTSKANVSFSDLLSLPKVQMISKN